MEVTGGGQIIADASEGGPGDTVGFTAQRTQDGGEAARGQFQFVPRGQSDNPSAPEEKFHGVVTCLISADEAQQNEQEEDDSNEEEALMEGARFGGFLRDDPQTFFTVDVTDNGQGSSAEDDLILVRLTEAPCADNPEDEDEQAEELVRLGRGNVKIHNNPDGASSPAGTAATAAGLARLAR